MLMDVIKAGTTFTLDYPRPIQTPATLGFCSLGIQKILLLIGNGKGQSIVFIPHVPNMVNFYEPLQNEDIMSANFTGCVMSTYKVNDKRRIGHVHTGEGISCRPAMKNEIETGGLTIIKTFKPYDDEDVALYKKYSPKFTNFTTFGVVTAKNEQFSIFTKKPTAHSNEYTVIKVKEQKNQPNEFTVKGLFDSIR